LDFIYIHDNYKLRVTTGVNSVMTRIGLALSGGGFRATLFHLGIIKFLKDAGLLENVSDIASVSGGSILAAHLAINWDKYNGDDESFQEAANEIIKFVKLDVRNQIVRRLPLQLPFRLISRLGLIDRKFFTPNALLEKYYKDYLFGDRCLYQLPEHPKVHILATCVSTGVLSAFNRNGLYIQKREGKSGPNFDYIPGQLITISRVVGASSAFPSFFPPVKITASDLGLPEGEFSTEYFTDGGVYDNLGLRAFSWLKENKVEHDHILVSDAGKPFQILSDPSLGIIQQTIRATDILWDRVWQLERENFKSNQGFLFLPVTELVNRDEDPTALHAIIQNVIQTIRTDLDRFSTHEINALVQHGYEVTRKLCLQDGILNKTQCPVSPPWKPIEPQKKAQSKFFLSKGKESAAKDTQIARKLITSSNRKIWSTLIDWKDWPSYLYLTLLFMLFIYLPYQTYKLYQNSIIQDNIINSIAHGDPDIHKILNLATTDPIYGWIPKTVGVQENPSDISYKGVEALSHSRFYDLRHKNPNIAQEGLQGKTYIYDRITFRFLESYKGNHKISFSLPTRLKDIEFRQPITSIQGKINRVKSPKEILGRKFTLYEVNYNLKNVLPNEPITIENEVLAVTPNNLKIPFSLQIKTDILSVWILFPKKWPYESYNLVTYPKDRSRPAEIMQKSYAIDHPYGDLIGWSVIHPDMDLVYECRWTYN
jgi:predicted acylesterase/phospholipase RssA